MDPPSRVRLRVVALVRADVGQRLEKRRGQGGRDAMWGAGGRRLLTVSRRRRGLSASALITGMVGSEIDVLLTSAARDFSPRGLHSANREPA